MEKKQTAVEWLVRKVSNELIGEIPMHRWDKIRDVVQQAKEMEKQQMIEFARGFWYYANGGDPPPVYPEDIEKYYKKTYEK